MENSAFSLSLVSLRRRRAAVPKQHATTVQCPNRLLGRREHPHRALSRPTSRPGKGGRTGHIIFVSNPKERQLQRDSLTLSGRHRKRSRGSLWNAAQCAVCAAASERAAQQSRRVSSRSISSAVQVGSQRMLLAHVGDMRPRSRCGEWTGGGQ